MRARLVAAKLMSLLVIVVMLWTAMPLSKVGAAGQLAPVPQDPVIESTPPRQQPALALAVKVTPEEVPVDGPVTVAVRLANEGNLVARNVVLTGTLAAGFDCPGCDAFFEPGGRRLQWRLPALEAGQVLTHTFTLQVRGELAWNGGGALTLGVRGDEAPQALATAVVRVPYPLRDGRAELALRPGAGGELVSADGRLTVVFPPEAAPLSLTVAYSPTAVVRWGSTCTCGGRSRWWRGTRPGRRCTSSRPRSRSATATPGRRRWG